jgi:hypothetical protein
VDLRLVEKIQEGLFKEITPKDKLVREKERPLEVLEGDRLSSHLYLMVQNDLVSVVKGQQASIELPFYQVNNIYSALRIGKPLLSPRLLDWTPDQLLEYMKERYKYDQAMDSDLEGFEGYILSKVNKNPGEKYWKIKFR